MSSRGKGETERSGFEPEVGVYPLQRFSKPYQSDCNIAARQRLRSTQTNPLTSQLTNETPRIDGIGTPELPPDLAEIVTVMAAAAGARQRRQKLQDPCAVRAWATKTRSTKAAGIAMTSPVRAAMNRARPSGVQGSSSRARQAEGETSREDDPLDLSGASQLARHGGCTLSKLAWKPAPGVSG